MKLGYNEKITYNQTELQQLKRRLEGFNNSEEMVGLEMLYPKLYLFKGNVFRWFIILSEFVGQEYFILVKCINKGNEKGKYDKYLKTPGDLYKEQITESYFKEIQKKLENEIRAEILQKQEIERKNKEIPKELELYLNKENIDHNARMFESSRWIEHSQMEEFTRNWHLIIRVLQGIEDNPLDSEIINVEKNGAGYCPIIRIKKNKDVGVIYEFYDTQNEKLFLLHNFFIGGKDNGEIEKIKEKYRSFNFSNEDEAFRKFARRGYPDFVLYDGEQSSEKNSWFKIQSEFESNLSLSMEEKKILKESELPLFINGQAGSGKSTVLYYFIADLIFRNRENIFSGQDEKSPILFLTYSNHLKETARKRVESIIRTNANYSDLSHEIDIERLRSIFQSMYDFLLSYVEPNNTKFVINKHISFSVFKALYLNDDVNPMLSKYVCNIPNKSEYSPELVWFVIKSYIKGQKEDSDFTPQEFSKLKDEEIEPNVYQQIYNSIYAQWYRKVSDDLWDDLDLVKYVLKRIDSGNNNYKPFNVIICDEAQDFSPVELKLILKVFSFSKYDLKNIKYLPIVFAGDPFQTINPAGFKLSRVKSMFYNSFNEIGFGNNLSLDQLSINFRSSGPIVRLANLVQFFRKEKLNIKEIKNQESWNDEGIKPLFFEIDNNSVDDEFLAKIKNTIILVPSMDRESVLKDFPELEPLKIKGNSRNESSLVKNVFDVLTYKGDESEKVVLYKFGCYLKTQIGDIEKLDMSDENAKIQAWFYFNKLYVAITRAQKKLLIVDTARGKEYFWNKLCKLVDVNDSKDYPDWSDLFSGVSFFAETNDKNELIEADPLRTAGNLKQSGIDNKDYEKMIRASEYYRENNQVNEAIYCKALSFEFRNDWKNAAREIRKLNPDYKQKHFEYCWNGKEWDDIISYGNDLKSDTVKSKVLAAEYITGRKNLIDLTNTGVVDNLKMNEEPWADFYIKLKNESEQNKFERNNESISEFYRSLGRVDPDFYLRSAEYAYKYDKVQAIKRWDDYTKKTGKEINITEYWLAKEECTSNVIEKIIYLEKARNNDERIIALYNRNKDNINSPEILEIMINKFKNAERYAEYMELLIKKEKNLYNVIYEYSNIFKHKEEEKHENALKLLFRDVISNSDANEILHLWLNILSQSNQKDTYYKDMLLALADSNDTKLFHLISDLVSGLYYNRLRKLFKNDWGKITFDDTQFRPYENLLRHIFNNRNFNFSELPERLKEFYNSSDPKNEFIKLLNQKISMNPKDTNDLLHDKEIIEYFKKYLPETNTSKDLIIEVMERIAKSNKKLNPYSLRQDFEYMLRSYFYRSEEKVLETEIQKIRKFILNDFFKENITTICAFAERCMNENTIRELYNDFVEKDFEIDIKDWFKRRIAKSYLRDIAWRKEQKPKEKDTKESIDKKEITITELRKEYESFINKNSLLERNINLEPDYFDPDDSVANGSETVTNESEVLSSSIELTISDTTEGSQEKKHNILSSESFEIIVRYSSSKRILNFEERSTSDRIRIDLITKAISADSDYTFENEVLNCEKYQYKVIMSAKDRIKVMFKGNVFNIIFKKI